MPMTPPASNHHHYQVRLVWAGLVILATIILTALVINYLQHRRQPETATSTTALSATPRSFSDAVGTVTKIDGTILYIDVMITDEAGQIHLRPYQVMSDDQTVIKSQTASGFSDSTFSAIKLGDHVQAAAGNDIAGVDHFTATKIFLLTNT